MKKRGELITIELGKGIELTAPFKKRWSVSEWRRMTAYIDRCIAEIDGEE
ncbi:hypothetical protein GOV10_01335 [Candidatus Woesearchaeota archaeon]|nr:hypothetical protein [Candidatus Woesearchaeota archaeon]